MAVEQRTGTAATLAIVAAVGGVALTFTGHPIWGLFIELAAIVIGALGLLMAASPRVGGGLLSVSAIVIAVFGLGLAVLGMFGALIT